ncbi:MAG: rRNA maturation RNase YbeY [Lachnospiraceae bacterium]|nr:rRNA maturation RNase YbeY [Lachnospiraceae bacterium]
MTVNFESEVKLDLDFDVTSEAERTINACLDHVSCPYETEVNLLITDSDGIHLMNKENRGIDAPTDVLSFPLIDYETPATFDFTESDEIELCNPDSGELMLGDIVINIDRVKSQAEEYGHSVKREFLFLICHSMLHLFGYDHEDDEEREKMEEMQKAILSGIGVNR